MAAIVRYHQLIHAGRVVVPRGRTAQTLLDYALANHLTIEVSGRETSESIETVTWVALP